MSQLNDAGSIASIAGVFIGLGAIAYAYFIKRKVDSISKKQKENAQGPYKMNTSKNLNEIHSCFRDIIRTAKKIDVESPEMEETIDYNNVNSELQSYYSENKSKMDVLLDKSIRDLGAWYDLDGSIRPQFEKIIEDFRWLTNNFFELDIDNEMQIRIWSDNYDSLLERKYQIEEIINSQQKILS